MRVEVIKIKNKEGNIIYYEGDDYKRIGELTKEMLLNLKLQKEMKNKGDYI